MSLIETRFVPAVLALSEGSKNAGTLARKAGYHDTRKHHLQVGRRNDYSIRLTRDKRGPDDESGGMDWTFRSAQRGDYREIAKFSRRLLDAGRRNDPRTAALREFYGNADLDRQVEGWDFVFDVPASSDSSHLWHIHLSFRRDIVNSEKWIDAVLSILKDEPLGVWQTRWSAAVEVKSGQSAPRWPHGPKDFYRPYIDRETARRIGQRVYSTGQAQHRDGVEAAQRQLEKRGWAIVVDGYLGEQTLAVVRKFQREKNLTVDGLIGPSTWRAIWEAPIT
ncbi:MAG: peptidoglycan-binding protein [Actinomycetota bacterium]|nr:peptidoglycan-binding protein [Actinomycetota bacterium]